MGERRCKRKAKLGVDSVSGAEKSGLRRESGRKGGDLIRGDIAKKGRILWVDLEMTGLVPGVDKILEVACLVTDWEFEIIDKYEGIVKVDEKVVEKRMVGEFWEKHKKVARKLQKQNESGKESLAIEKELLEFVNKNFTKGEKILLAGNSVHQDRKFIDEEWGLLAQKLHYRMLDVSAWKVVFGGKFEKEFKKEEKHRAMEDILGSIEELKYYLTMVKGGVEEKC